MSKQCPKCKFINDPEFEFCTECGTALGKNEKTKKKAKKQRKAKPKRSVKKFMKVLMCLLIPVTVIVFAWFAFGNAITLYIHTNKDLEIFNSGSLEVPGANYSRYSQLPDYVVEMLGEDPDAPDYGMLMSQIIPHIRVERNKINGFFGGNSVEYTIYAPDMESWLLNLDTSKVYTAEMLMEEMEEYIPNAPVRSQVVTVEYAHDGFFEWQGNYMDVDFANAVSGGINTAYNELYSDFSEQLKEMMK